MNRKEITSFLGELLIHSKLSGIGKYWASEVSLDFGTTEVKRVDFMQFEPAGVVGISGIEKGIFICYEIKSCKADFESGFGRNFIGEKNYFVMPMVTYKEVAFDIPPQALYCPGCGPPGTVLSDVCPCAPPASAPPREESDIILSVPDFL